MKTKQTCVAAGEKMKSAILYPYGPLTGTICCRMLHAKNLAITSAIYTVNISILIVLIYSWRISVNVRKSSDLEDVYYGVQIAYLAIIGTQMSMIVLSIMLMFGIYKENAGLIVPWIIGYITFMALEAVAMVYSNVLRDHVNKQFDAMCKAEVAFFIARAFINVLAMWGVLRFYNLVRAGITWKGPEAKTTFADGVSSRKRGRHQRENSNCSAAKTTGCFFFDFDDCDEDEEGDEEDEGDEEEDVDHVDDYNYDAGDSDYDEDAGCYEDDDGDDYCEEQEIESGSSDCGILARSSRGLRLGRHFYRSASGQQLHRHHQHHHHHHRHHNYQHNHQRQQRHHHRSGSSNNNNNNNNNNVRSVLINKRHNKYKIAHPHTKLEVIDEQERSAGSGSDEHDSLLVACANNNSTESV